MLSATCNGCDEYLEAEALGKIQRSNAFVLVDSVPELPSVIVAPRKEFSVAALHLLQICARSAAIDVAGPSLIGSGSLSQ